MPLYRLLLRSFHRSSPLNPTISSLLSTCHITTTRPYIPFSFYARCEPSIEQLKLDKSVRATIEVGDVDAASSIVWAALMSKTQHPHLETCDELIQSMHQAGRYHDVIELFRVIYKESGEGDHGILIQALCDSGQVDQALKHFHHLALNFPHLTDATMYRHLTKALISANRISEARDLLLEMRYFGQVHDALAYNNIICGYLELHDVENAKALFHELLTGSPFWRPYGYDGSIYATFMDYYFKHNMEKEAMESYQCLLDQQLHDAFPQANNSVLEVLLKHGKRYEAYAFFDKLLNTQTDDLASHSVDSQTFNLMVNECFRLGKVSEALEVFKRRGSFENDKKPFVMDTMGYNNIIGKLCEIGMVAEAENLFQDMLTKPVATADVTTFKILLNAYFEKERIDDVWIWLCFLLFETELKPSSALLNSVFARVISKGRLEETVVILGRMIHVHQDLFQRCSEPVLTELCKQGKLDCVRNLLGLMETYDISVTPTLHAIVREAFAKETKIDQSNNLFDKRIEDCYGLLQPATIANERRVDQIN